MRRMTTGRRVVASLAALSLLFLCGCFQEKARTEQKAVAVEAAAPPAPRPPRDEVRPAEGELSLAARETYAYLLFIQALLDEDEAALLDVTPDLAEAGAPLNVWVDGGVWLMGRKSPNSVVFLESALKARPSDLSLNLLYSEALAQHGMVDKGIAAMRSFLAGRPDALDAKLQLALLLVKDKKFAEARSLLDSIPPSEKDPLIPFYQAKALIGMGKKGEAVPYLKKVVRSMPDFVEPVAELALIYEEEGNLREARAAYEKLLSLNFSPQEVALNLINLSLKMRQPEKAAQYARQGPDSLPFRLRAANMFLESRHYLQAENILKKIAGDEGAPYETYLMLADLAYDQRRDLKGALAWLDRIPPDSPGAVKGRLQAAQLMAEAGKNAEALETIDKAIAAFPDNPELWDMRIRLLARARKMDEALTVARDAAKKWPDSPQIAFLLGSLLDERGLKKEAFTVMEGILQKQPENFQALNYVGFSLAEENRDLPRALELLNRANELSPNQAYIIDSLAWALFRSGQLEEALRQIRRAVSMGDSPDPAIWEHYGDIAARQGLKEEARKAYRKAIELKPANMDDIRRRMSQI